MQWVEGRRARWND